MISPKIFYMRVNLSLISFMETVPWLREVEEAGCVSSSTQSLAEGAPVDSMGQLLSPSPRAKAGLDLIRITTAYKAGV